MKSTHVLIQPFDKVSQARVNVYVAVGSDPACYGLNNRAWDEAFASPPEISGTGFNPDLDGKIQVLQGRFTLIAGALTFPPGVKMKDLAWKGAPITIWSVSDLQYASRTTLLTATVKTASYDRDRRRISFEVQGSYDFMDREVMQRVFDGSGGLGGEPSVRDTIKPAGWGYVENLEPVFYDNTRSMAMLDGYGNLQSIDWVAEGLNRYTSFAGNYATEALLAAALDAGTVLPGQWASCLADGVIGFGAPPIGIVTCNATFANHLSGSMMKDILINKVGLTSGYLDTSSFDALDAVNTREVRYWTNSQENAKSLIERICQPVLVTPQIDNLGRIAISQIFGGSSIGNLDKSGNQTPRVVNHRPTEAWTPVARTVARAARPAVILRRDQINFADDFVPRGTFKTTETYRQGDTVFAADKSEWLYTNTTPKTGAAAPLPVWPTTSNGDWTNIGPPNAPAILGSTVVDGAGNVVYSDNVINNHAITDWWKEGATIPWSLNPANVANAIYAFPRAGWPAEVTGPMGTQDDCWYCEDSDGDTGGGWNGGQVRPLDPDKTYRFVVPIMHGGNSAGNAYWGCTNVCDLNTTTSASNPYFCVLNQSQMVQHRWYLFVAYIHPRNSSSKTHSDAGIWDTVTGQKLTAGFTANNFCFRPDGLQPTYRAYQYYVGDTSYQMFGKPLIECIDGTQSDLRGYFRAGALTYNVAQKLTAIGPATIKIEGATASKASGGGFDAAVRGERISGPVYAAATIRQEDGHTMVGLTTGAGQYDRPDAKIYIQYRWGTGAVEIWTGGASPAWTGTIAANLTGEVMVTYDRRGYSATVAGTPVGGFYAAQPDLAHYPVFYVYDGSNATILGLKYGPATDNLTAAGDIKLTNIGGAPALIFGNTISATSGSYAETVRGEAIQGPCFAEIDIIADYIYCMVCLDDSPTSTVNTSQRIWVYYNYGLGYLYVSIPGAGGYGNTIGQFTGKLRVAYDGANWRITVGSTEPFTTSAPAGLSLVPKWYTYNTGVSYTGLRAGPFNDARWSSIGPIGKPEDYSTRGNNRNYNGDASAGLNGLYDHATINGGVDLATGSNAIGGDASFRFYKTSNSDYVTRAWRAIPVIPRQKYFVRAKIKGSSATASGLYIRLAQGVAGADPTSLNPHGSSGGIEPLIDNGPVSTSVVPYEFPYVVPDGVYWVSVGILNWAGGPTNMYVDDVYFGETESGADVTSAITGPSLVEVAYNNDGTVKSGQLPKAVNFQLYRNGVDVTTAATWSVDDVITGSVTSSFTSGGVLSVTAVGTSKNRIRVKAVYQGSNRTFELDINKNIDPAPTGGGGGGGTSATQTVSFSSSSTSMATASPDLEFTTGAAGTATLTGVINFEADGGSPTGTYGAYWIYKKWNGSSWVDEGTETYCTATTVVDRYYDDYLGDYIYGTTATGELNVAKTVTGLGANTAVKFRLCLRCASSGRTLFFTSNPNIGGSGS